MALILHSPCVGAAIQVLRVGGEHLAVDGRTPTWRSRYYGRGDCRSRGALCPLACVGRSRVRHHGRRRRSEGPSFSSLDHQGIQGETAVATLLRSLPDEYVLLNSSVRYDVCPMMRIAYSTRRKYSISIVAHKEHCEDG